VVHQLYHIPLQTRGYVEKFCPCRQPATIFHQLIEHGKSKAKADFDCATVFPTKRQFLRICSVKIYRFAEVRLRTNVLTSLNNQKIKAVRINTSQRYSSCNETTAV
jgi:hypothetical protein